MCICRAGLPERYLDWSVTDYRERDGAQWVDADFRRHLKPGCSEAAINRSRWAPVLSSLVDRAGLSWATVDPGMKTLGWWRRKLCEYGNREPRCVVINTTFFTDFAWTQSFCEAVRRALPQTTIMVGGYQYATDVRAFLQLEADVPTVGEGENRLPQLVRSCRDGTSLKNIPGL